MKIRYIYILIARQFMWRFKAGISGNVAARIGQIESELSYITGKPVQIRCAAKFPVIFPAAHEGKIHDWFERRRASMPNHSGKTEWFLIRNWMAVILFFAVGQYYGLEIKWWHLVVIYFFPIPFDAIILAGGLAAVEYSVFLAVVMLVGLGVSVLINFV